MTALETDDFDHYIKTHGRKTATIDVVGELANVMIDLLQLQQARTAALETRLAQIGSKPHVTFVGTWKSGRT